ncbi:glycosyltransferase family 4 protein [Listeria rustica]|nr:glycosyltransferase family 4 protein [Listeria rustica]
MNSSVTMFVWNEFENDGRVLRECTALEEAGYDTTLLALSKDKTFTENYSDQLKIKRLGSQLPILTKTWQKSLLFITLLLLIYYLPLLAIAFISVYALLYKTKIRFLYRKVALIFKMIYWGWKENTDIYHANDLNTLLQAVICGKWLRRRKVLFDSHEVNLSRSGYDSFIYPLAESFLLRFVDRSIQENHTRAKFIEKVYHFLPDVIYNYPFYQADIENSVDLHSQLGLAENEPILLYQGGLQKDRGLDKLLEAVPFIERGTVVFIGDGKMKPYLEEETKRRNLGDKVKFLEKVPVEELPRYTRDAYLGFQLLNDTCFNHYSAASNKLFEYLMAGVPLVACDFPEIRQVVRENKVGIVVKSDEPTSIAKGINQLVADPEMREKMHQNALIARERYNWNNEKVNFLKIYQKLVEV